MKYLGFAKLKDFISRNDNLEIYNKGPNYPHVRISNNKDDSRTSSISNMSRKSSKDSNSNIECAHDLIDKVYNIIKMYLFSYISLSDIVDTFKSLH